MATLVRPWQVRYVTKDGKRVKKGTPGARKVKERARKWYGQGIPGRPPKERVPLSSDKTVAQQMLAELVRDGERGRVNLPRARQRAKSLLDHLEDYGRYLLAKGNTEEHSAKTVSRCRAVLGGADARDVGDLQPSAVVEALAALRRPTRPVGELPAGKEWFTKSEVVALLAVCPAGLASIVRREAVRPAGNGKARRYPRALVEALLARLGRGRGPSTVNHYLTAVKGFSRWLARDGRAPSDPLAFLPRQNAEVDVRVERRALEPDEFGALLDAARAGRPFRGLAGPARAALYLFAARTGLRASELASLTPESIDFAREEAVVEAAYSKHRRKDLQPVPADLMAPLRDFCKAARPGEPLWPGTWALDGAEMLRADLAAAGVPYAGGRGRTYDFHALRHQFISDLVNAGVHPKDAQQLARHSTITLTLDRYAHVRPANLRAALDRLPALEARPGPDPARERA